MKNINASVVISDIEKSLGLEMSIHVPQIHHLLGRTLGNQIKLTTSHSVLDTILPAQPTPNQPEAPAKKIIGEATI